MQTIDQCRTGPTDLPLDRNASRYTQCRVRKRSNECESEKRLVKSQRSGVALTERGGSWGPRRFVHYRQTPLAANFVSGWSWDYIKFARLYISFASTGTRIDSFFSGRSLNRTAHGRHLSLFFYLPSSVGLLLTVRTRFLYE